MLECRVFIPKTYQSGTKLPLYIDMHGGGFMGASPTLDDMYCHTICNRFNYVVVSIEYRLAPSFPFPIPVDDCTELALVVLEDPDLPIDHAKVAMGGQSAGANLALTASQDPRLGPRIKAIVAFYPPTDFSHVYSGDFRDKPADASGKGAAPDMLRPIAPMCEWAYPPHGQDLTDPKLSPMYADPASLPRRIYFIAAEWDKLCKEAFAMACKLAKNDTKDEAENFDKNGIRWERLPNEIHGFIEEGWQSELFKKAERPWKKEVDDVINRVGEWTDGVFRES